MFFRLADAICSLMDVVQCRMARGALNWSARDLAEAAGVSRPSVARFEMGETVRLETVQAMRRAFESEGVRFLHSGQFAGAVVPPKLKPDESARNPILPGRGD